MPVRATPSRATAEPPSGTVVVTNVKFAPYWKLFPEPFSAQVPLSPGPPFFCAKPTPLAAIEPFRVAALFKVCNVNE